MWVGGQRQKVELAKRPDFNLCVLYLQIFLSQIIMLHMVNEFEYQHDAKYEVYIDVQRIE